METTMTDPATALLNYMIELCEEHRSASWTASWEHELWDALLSDGTLGHYRDEFEDEVGCKLLNEELTKLRELFHATKCWHVFKPHNGEDLRFVYALVYNPKILQDNEHTNTVRLSVEVWKNLHIAWLQTPSGKYNLSWRDSIKKETGRTVEELAVMRDNLFNPDYQALAVELRKPTDHQHPASRTILSWLPEQVRDEVLKRQHT
jgi:hypothetical protein